MLGLIECPIKRPTLTSKKRRLTYIPIGLIREMLQKLTSLMLFHHWGFHLRFLVVQADLNLNLKLSSVLLNELNYELG